MIGAWLGDPRTPRAVPADIADDRAPADSTEPNDPADPTENADPAEPIEQIDRAEPTDPTDRIDPFDPMHSSESSDHIDHFESATEADDTFRRMLTAITSYDIGKFIHVATVIVALGAPFAYAPFTQLAERTNPRAVPTVLRALRRVDFTIVTPGLILILAAGIYMLADASIRVAESWVSVGIASIVVLFAIVHGVVEPAVKRAIELAERDLSQGDELSDEYRALSRRIGLADILAGVVVLIAAFFMVVKP